MKPKAILVAWIIANALLYSAMLPLWEGFDEPFHFSYVQRLANGQGFPDPRTSSLSHEIDASIPIAPASGVVQMNVPNVKTYSQYFALNRGQRGALRTRLNGLPPEWRWGSSHSLNYEAQQTPLAYMLLAVPERVLARMPLPHRVLALRIVAALGGAFLLYFGAETLFRELGLDGAYKNAALFCIFSSQMTWATIAHVANDWLAVPLAVWSLVAAIRYWRAPSRRTVLWMGVVLALGLLAKAYFLAFVPLGFGLCAARRRVRDVLLLAAVVVAAAGPWYARNALRYGSLTGTIQARAGIGVVAALRAAPGLDWPRMVWGSIRAALWTGNNTFLSFSVATLTAIVVVWLIALVLWAGTAHGNVEWISALHCGLFLAALGYDAAVESLYAQKAVGTAAWYPQAILAPMLGLAFLGCMRWSCMRWKWPGRAVATALIALSGYVLAATYVAKLIPLYGGYEGRASPGSLIALYSHRLPILIDNLNFAALAPASLLLSLAAIVCVLAVAQMAALIRSIN